MDMALDSGIHRLYPPNGSPAPRDRGPSSRRPAGLIALLEARLASERECLRGVAAILVKHGAGLPARGAPTRADLECLRDEVLRRVELVERALVELDGERRRPRR